jgi:hypothetical protein
MPTPTPTQPVGYGQARPNDFSSDHAARRFGIEAMLLRARTVQLGTVTAVSGGGTGAAPGTVTVQPLVNQMDGSGNSVPHGPLNNVPFLRLMGASGAVVGDPVVGDVGLLLVCDRDISAVAASNGKAANPGSRRRHHLSDSVYLGGLFGSAPQQYLAFTASGVTIQDKNGNSVTLSASGTTIKDNHGNQITLSSTGFDVKDAAGNEISSGTIGTTIKDNNGNQIQMRTAGIVNVVCTQFEVNGVPVTVP